MKAMRRGLPAKTIILTYHDMLERRGRGALWFDCTVGEFRQQLDRLQKQRASFVSLDALYRHLTDGSPLPPNPVVVTFADNYLGFYRLALPILRERRIPCAMFVHTGFVGSAIGRPKMNWRQLREIDREGLVTVASQTVTHPADLARLDDASVRREMTESKRQLEQELGHRIDYLAYPNGKFDTRSVAAAKSAGYRMAFTEAQTPAEQSPGIYEVARYVHTKLAKAWRDAH